MISTNFISNLRPELKIYFKNEEDFYKYTICSDARVWVKCPDCGHEHKMIVKNLTRRHYSCPVCKSNYSFPERVVMAILDQVNICYKYHLNKKILSWCDNYIYDFYIPSLNLIIETHGSQHYKNAFKFNSARTLKQQQEIDLIKKNLVYLNNYNYLEIDCSEQSGETLILTIKNALSSYIDLSHLDWRKVLVNASKSNIVEICSYWEQNKSTMDTVDLANYFNCTRDFIVRTLHRGTDAGLCFYNGKRERKRASEKGQNQNRKNYKKIFVFSKEGVFIKEYSNIQELCKNFEKDFNTKITKQGVWGCANGSTKTHKNFIFRYDKNIK